MTDKKRAASDPLAQHRQQLVQAENMFLLENIKAEHLLKLLVGSSICSVSIPTHEIS